MSILNPKWYIEQFKNWSLKSYFLLLFGLGIIIGSTISNPMNLNSVLTMLAGVLGFTCTVAITNAKPLNGVLGLTSALIYIVVASQARNFADVVLQASYILLLDIPVLISPKWAKDVESKIRGLKKHQWLYVILMAAVIEVALYLMDTRVFISPRPLIDSVAGMIGITGAILCTLRFREQYYFWTVQGIMSIVLWGLTALHGDSSLVLFFTYILYLTNDSIAFFDKKTHWFN